MGLRSRLFAWGYDRMMTSAERDGFADVRRRTAGAAAGNVLEIGAGTGLNLPYYTPAVEHLTLTEPDASMLRRLDQAAARSGRPVSVLRAAAEDLPFEDSTFDAVVCTLVLCGVDDQPRAVCEIGRVLRPGGLLLFAEHVRSDDEAFARRQDRRNWVTNLFSGCDCNRQTQRELEAAGFRFAELTHGELPHAPSFARPMISGRATRTNGAYAFCAKPP
jgi:ubiquinone/menaquinone biosynthesis C-methylase UbiE